MARPLFTALVLAALALGVARADFITKKDGTVIEGEVTRRDESRVVVTMKDGTVVEIPRSAIDRITREKPDPNAKAPAEPKPPAPADPAPEPKSAEPAEVDSATQPEPLKPTPAPIGSNTKPKAPRKDGILDYEDLLAEYSHVRNDEPARQAFLKKYDKKPCRMTVTLLEAKEGTITMTVGSRGDPDGMKIEVPCLRLKVETSHGAVSEGYPVYINKLLSMPKPGEAPKCDLTDINKMKKAPKGSTVFIDGKILASSNPPMALCDPKYSFTPPKKDP